jgi:hypothetical protein
MEELIYPPRLAQGSILSPTLWNIFYDAMLTAIDDLSVGFILPTGSKEITPAFGISSAFPLHISMTSIGAIKDIAIIGSHPTTRQVLKISDYQLVEAITNQLSLFETYPTISMITNDPQAPAELSRTLSNESSLESEIGQSVIYPFKTLTPYERD